MRDAPNAVLSGMVESPALTTFIKCWLGNLKVRVMQVQFIT